MKKLIILLFIFLLNGCASIVGDSDYYVNIRSDTPSVTYKIYDKKGYVTDSGVTPTTVYLRSSSGYFSREVYKIETSKDGYISSGQILKPSVSNWYIFGNILVGGIIGWLIVDPLTGAMYTLPDEVNVSIGSKIPEQNKL